MKAVIKKELHSRFKELMGRRLPHFSTIDDPHVGEHDLMWSASVSPDLTLFIYMSASDTRDEFTIEAAWSDDGRYPWNDDCFKFEDVTGPKGRARLRLLWVADGHDRMWEIVPRQTSEQLRAKLDAQSRGDWEAVRQIRKALEVPLDEAVRRVGPLVANAVEKIVQYGIPLFRRIAVVHGVKWDAA